MNNKKLIELNREYQNTKFLFRDEKAKANKHKIYAELRLQFLDWLEKGFFDQSTFTYETPEFNVNDLSIESAWQEAIFMFSDELKEDGFYCDIIGQVKNYKITYSYSSPEQNKESRKLVDAVLKNHKELRKVPYELTKSFDLYFKQIFNLPSKYEVVYHPNHQAFTKLICDNYVQGDDFKSLVIKINEKIKGL